MLDSPFKLQAIVVTAPELQLLIPVSPYVRFAAPPSSPDQSMMLPLLSL